MLRAGALAGAAMLLGGGGWYVYRRLRQPIEYTLYWRNQAGEEVPPGALRLVALGDSSTMAIGADRPEDGFVGRTAAYLRERTGRGVHIANLARGGAHVGDVLSDQVPEADLARSDLVMVSVGSADALDGDPLEPFERDMRALLTTLPAPRTVFSDVAAVPGHRPYQEVLARLADDRGIRRAAFEDSFRAAGRTDIFAADGVHLNSTGYRIWFEAFRPQVDAVLGLP